MIKNFFLCMKYPFLKAVNMWTGKSCGYKFTWYDFIPVGWQRAFGKQLCEDLKRALKKDNMLYKFQFTQVKEKFGELRLYNNGCGKETQKVIAYYEDISKAYCINCGKPARYVTDGWIEYYCEDCALDYILRANEYVDKPNLEDVDKQLESMRLTDKCLGEWRCQDPEMQKVHDDIDWNKLWGLDENGK